MITYIHQELLLEKKVLWQRDSDTLSGKVARTQ